MAGDGQQQADGSIPGQEGEEPGHQGFPLPHGQRLQEAVIRSPAGTQANIAGLEQRAGVRREGPKLNYCLLLGKGVTVPHSLQIILPLGL